MSKPKTPQEAIDEYEKGGKTHEELSSDLDNIYGRRSGSGSSGGKSDSGDGGKKSDPGKKA